MTNGDRMEFAFIGILMCAGVIGFAIAPVFILLSKPVVWFLIDIFLCAPIGAWVGWRYGPQIERWLEM